MIVPLPGARVWLATGMTDMRRGMNSLALQVQRRTNGSRSDVAPSGVVESDETADMSISTRMASGRHRAAPRPFQVSWSRSISSLVPFNYLAA
jgi:hypothetical protein